MEDSPTYLPAVPNFTVYKPRDLVRNKGDNMLSEMIPPVEVYDSPPELPTIKLNFFGIIQEADKSKVSNAPKMTVIISW